MNCSTKPTAGGKQQKHAEELAEVGIDQAHKAPWQRPAQKRCDLVAARACGLQRSWQRASSEQHSEQIGAGIGGALRHVLRLEMVLADHARDGLQPAPIAPCRPRDVILAAGREGDQRRGDEGDAERDEGRSDFATTPNMPNAALMPTMVASTMAPTPTGLMS